MKNRIVLYLLLIICTWQFSCYSPNQITSDNELQESLNGTLYIFSSDSTLYKLTEYVLTNDSSFKGSGYKVKNDLKENFQGNIHMSDIEYIYSKDFDFFNSLIAAASIGFVGVTALTYLDDTQETNFQFREHVIYPAGYGSSCPFIYSWNGNNYELEGEAFGAALGK